MARYTLPVGNPRFKGSRGKAVFQKSGMVYAIRSRKSPRKNITARKTKSQNVFASMTQRWRGLTTGQKNTFKNNAHLFPRTNSLGDSYVPSGQNMQTSTNNKRNTFAFAPVNTLSTPTTPTAVIWDTIAIQPSTSAMDLVVTANIVQANYTIIFFVSPPVSPGTVSDLKDMKQIGFRIAGQNTATKNWFTEYTALFGQTASKVGQQVNAIFQVVQALTGQVMLEVYGSGFIEP